MHSHEIKSFFKKSWQITKRHFWFLCGIQIVIGLLNLVIPLWLQQTIGLSGTELGVINIVLFVVSTFLTLGFYRIMIRLTEGQGSTWKDLVSEAQGFGAYLFSSLAYGLIGLGPLVVIILLTYHVVREQQIHLFPAVLVATGLATLLPGMLLARVQFFPWFILEERLGALGSLKASWVLTRHHSAGALLVLVATQVAYVVGIIAFGLGLFATVPMATIVSWLVFKKLRGT